MGELETKSSSGSVGTSREPSRKAEIVPCLGCNDGKTDLKCTLHKMSECEVFKLTPLKELLSRVKCRKCPYATDGHIYSDCKRSMKCHHCKEADHHALLCSKKRQHKSKTNASHTKFNFIENVAADGLNPVMCQAQFIKVLCQDGSYYKKLEGVWDTYASDNYITHKYANQLGYVGRQVTLSIEGFGKNVTTLETFMYAVSVEDLFGVKHTYYCYWTDEITTPEDLPELHSYKLLCKKFGVLPNEVTRPRHINLLLSMRESQHHPVKLRSIGQMTLFENCFGKTFGGCDSDLKFTPHRACYQSQVVEVSEGITTKTRTMKAMVKSASMVSSKRIDQQFMDYCREESIGVHFFPSCGGCRCGKCNSGDKAMSLKDEKAYSKFAANLTFCEAGTIKDPGPYYVMQLPWSQNRNDLPNNKKQAVLGVMSATKRKFRQDSDWEEIYESQLLALIQKGFAEEVSDEELENWTASGQPLFYLAHQMVVQPDSTSTPIRVVYNSSQN